MMRFLSLLEQESKLDPLAVKILPEDDDVVKSVLDSQRLEICKMVDETRVALTSQKVGLDSRRNADPARIRMFLTSDGLYLM